MNKINKNIWIFIVLLAIFSIGYTAGFKTGINQCQNIYKDKYYIKENV